MKNQRRIVIVVSTFCLTVCLLGMFGGMVLSDLRSGRTVFGNTYEHVWISNTDAVAKQNTVLDLGWLPARWQLLYRVPLWETRAIQWLLSRQ